MNQPRINRYYVEVPYTELVEGVKYKIIEHISRIGLEEFINYQGSLFEGIFYGRGDVKQEFFNGETVNFFYPNANGKFLRFKFPHSNNTGFPLKIDFIYAHEYNKFYEKNSDYYHYHTLSKKTNAFSNPNPLNLPNGISKNVENFLGGRKKKNKTKRNKNKKNKTNKKKKIYKSKKN